jgi:DNA-binding response OmpR family regulator
VTVDSQAGKVLSTSARDAIFYPHAKAIFFEGPLISVKPRIRSLNEAQAEQTFVHSEVALDLLTRRVTAAGIEHGLTAREFTMFEFLLRHPGQLISREQLLSRVWGLGHDPANKVVDVYIRYLRQKLGTHFIHTVRGMGYRLG